METAAVDARHEHHGRPTAHGGDESIVAADMRLSVAEGLPGTAGIRIRGANSQKRRLIRKNDRASLSRRGRDTSALLLESFYTTKTQG